MTVLGAMEVSVKGDLANWIIPGEMVKGMGGAMDLADSGTKLIVAMEHTTKSGRGKIVNKCSLPLTSPGVVSKIITELGVFDIVQDGIKIVELSKNVTLEELKSKSPGIEFI